jgi:ArsR family transcriptional regulator, arsenate/arsenite/antimonite-responsive transcriptional repressor
MGFEEMAECYKALGDKTRLKILALLKVEDLCVCEFVEVLKMTQPAVSQHIRKLKNVKLVKERRQGQWIFYSLDRDRYPHLHSVWESLPDLSDEVEKLKVNGKKVYCTD